MHRRLACLAAMALACGMASAAPAFVGKRVDAQALAAQRGGTDSGSSASLQATLSGNSAVNTTTGGNSIGGGAFANAAGVPVVVQNSGNNMVIQSSTVINLTLK